MLIEKSLDEWYRNINKVYLDRNFYRNAESIFAHIVEIMGGLSLLASEKTKVGVDPQEYIAKAIAWWLALCGKMRIASVEDMIWSKYPYVCPYCQQNPHRESQCKAKKKTMKTPDWTRLHEIAETNKHKKPKTLGDWLLMFSTIYEPTQNEDYKMVFARFTEEIGELSEATRLFQLAPGYFFSESSDFFAWLMHVQALYIFKNNTPGQEAEIIENAVFNQYPGKCKDCGNALCTCPPVLRKTFGRIAHEMPIIISDRNDKPLLDLSEAMEAFELSSKVIQMGNKEIIVDQIIIKDIHKLVKEIRGITISGQGKGDAQTLILFDILKQIESLADSERVTQESIDDLATAIAELPSDKRENVLDFLKGVSSSVWATALIEVVKSLV